MSLCLFLMLPSCLLRGPVIVNENLVQPDPEKQVLDVAAFSDADWEYFGFYDGGGSYEHQYGGQGPGYYEYHFRGLDQPPKAFIVRARLSAESHSKGQPSETSDVTLSVNGVEIGTQTVAPDDMEGRVYEWRVDEPAMIQRLQLRPSASNSLRFTVKDEARHKNGLCLYGAALSKEGDPVPVTIEMPRPELR